MNELALFAGIGGGLLGTTIVGAKTICAVEKEPYCREVLIRRQRDGLLPVFPLNLLYAGFPGSEEMRVALVL